MESILTSVLFLVGTLGFMYFVFIRPENKRTKELEAMKKSVKTGDKISTIGGIYGTVVSDSEEKVVIETGADRVRIELGRWAIGNKVKDKDGDDE